MRLTDIDLSLADADALILLATLRTDAIGYTLGSDTGFSLLSRAIVRILKRVITGDASRCVRGPGNADGVMFALLGTIAHTSGVVADVTRSPFHHAQPRATDINGRTDR